MSENPKESAISLSDRQKTVMDAALQLLVDGDEALTMSNIARAASCSKETLYKWFGDRDMFLEAMVEWQASRVRIVPLSRNAIDAQSLFTSLEHFARDWLMVLSSKTSIALNRLAVSHAISNKSKLGAIVLHNGISAVGRRLKPILQLGREAGLLRFNHVDDVFRTFFGLVVGDMQIRVLLGDDLILDDEAIIREASKATRQFFTLYGGDNRNN